MGLFGGKSGNKQFKAQFKEALFQTEQMGRWLKKHALVPKALAAAEETRRSAMELPKIAEEGTRQALGQLSVGAADAARLQREALQAGVGGTLQRLVASGLMGSSAGGALLRGAASDAARLGAGLRSQVAGQQAQVVQRGAASKAAAVQAKMGGLGAYEQMLQGAYGLATDPWRTRIKVLTSFQPKKKKSLFGSLLGAAATAAGTALGGPIGGAIGGAVGDALGGGGDSKGG